jgi:outer membrane protein assembly factor BamA
MMFRILVAVVASSAFAFSASTQGRLGDSQLPFNIRSVHYRNTNLVPVAEREETTRQLRQAVNGPNQRRITNLKDLRDTATEYARRLLEDEGFWNSRIEVNLVKHPPTRTIQPVDVVFQITDGPRIYLSGVVWTGMTVFTGDELQKQIPIHAGEVASRRGIAEGLQAARKLYASRGYVNFTVVPDSKIDEAAHTMAIALNGDEGAQFRFGELILPGLDDVHTNMVLQRWEAIRGDVYSPQQEESFFRSVMWPAYLRHEDFDYRLFSQVLNRRLNEQEKTINFSVSFVAQSRDAD